MERGHLAEQLEGVRLVLRRATPLAEDEKRALDAERARFGLFFPALEPALVGPPLHDAFAREVDRLWASGEEYAYALRQRADGAFVGHASVHALSFEHERAEIAYWVTEKCAGQGFASEAVGTLEAHLFARGFHRVEIRCDALNESSRKVAERCGYVLEGRLREHMRRRDGTYRDSLVFGKLLREYEAERR